MSSTYLFGPIPPPFGGVSIYVLALHAALRREGIDCPLFAARMENDPEAGGVRPRFGSVFWHFRAIRSGDVFVDSASYFLEYRSGMAPLAWLWIRKSRKFRWIKILHDNSLPERYTRFGFLRKCLIRCLVRSVDEFVTVSEDLFHWLRDVHRVRGKVHLIRSLLPVPQPDPDTPLPPGIDQALSSRSWWVSSIGVFTPAYGFHHLAEGVERLRRETGDDIGLVLIDGGFILDDVEAYKSSVLRGRDWILVLETVPHLQVLQILRRSSVFVRGPASESYGLSRIEAVLAGTPVVATPVGETRGMLLFEHGDIRALTAQIHAAFSSKGSGEIRAWADRFRREAEENARQLVGVISPAGRPS